MAIVSSVSLLITRMRRTTNISFLFVLFYATFAAVAIAQNPAAPPPLPGTEATRAKPQTDLRYRIGAGDVLEVRVFNRPQLSRDAVRVDATGMIRMPLLETDIRAACRTESELAAEIAKLYLEYQRNPYVEVFVKEFNSQPVSVVGAVANPGRFQLQRRVRLLELLTIAGGTTEKAGRQIHILHTNDALSCDETEAQDSDDQAARDVTVVGLDELMRGADAVNQFVRPGDIISVPDVEQLFVVGNVYRPTTIPLREPITLSRAIAMAGGVLPDTNKDGIRIIRQNPGSPTKTELRINLKAIHRAGAEDIVLQAGDIVDVPISGKKRFKRILATAFAPAVAYAPFSIIR